MSNHLGFKALVHRFVKRFPEPQYRYVTHARETLVSPPNTSVESITHYLDAPWNKEASLHSPIVQEVYIYHYATDALVCSIWGRLDKNLQLKINSKHLPQGLFRLPPQVRRPKFAKLGASLSAHIAQKFKESTK